MTLQPGTRLGSFQVATLLGRGGMGEVYRARDTRLGREVAVKVLPEGVAGDPERLQRFEREARVLASLNHANIATLHGFFSAAPVAAGAAVSEPASRASPAPPAESGRGDDVHFLVMELVEGDTLADRIARGPVPVDEAVSLFVQIAAGLEAAHERGVIHRDLKPANIKLGGAPGDPVKILDFGLAKALADPGSGSGVVDASLSPTLTLAATQRGEILGTAAYMSPEQAKGRAVDKRTDIWAFGCCLWEALCGERLFEGDDFSEILASVLKDQPDLGRLPATTPRAVRRVLERCLVKDPRNRQRDIGDVRLELQAAGAAPEPAAEATVPPVRSVRIRVLIAAAAGVVAGVLAALAFTTTRDAPAASAERPVPLHTQIVLPAEAALPLGRVVGYDPVYVALSPDGTELVTVGMNEEGSRLYYRDLTRPSPASPIPGTEGAIFASFSPDGRWLGFLDDDKLIRIAPDGSDLRVLCDVRNAQRALWSGDGWIYFGDDEGGTLRRVPETGGAVEDVTFLEGKPADLHPGGHWLLVSSWAPELSSGDYGSVQLLDLETLEVRSLFEGGYDPRWFGSGHLLYGRGGDVQAIRFDAGTGTVSGEPVTVLRGVSMDSSFTQVQIAVSRAGTVAYVPGGDRAVAGIAIVDPDGGSELLPIEPRLYGAFDLSDDDRYLAVHVGDVRSYIWIYDLELGQGRRLPGSSADGWPVWSHDGERIAFSRVTRGDERMRVMVARADGTGEPVELLQEEDGSPSLWTPDDRHLLINDWAGGKIGVVATDGSGAVSWIESDDDRYMWPAVSPDGRWLVHSDLASSGFWIRSFPGAEAVRRLSELRGGELAWCGSCNRIFYAGFQGGRGWYSVEVSPGAPPTLGPPQLAFTTEYVDTRGRSFDVSSDGQRLFVVKPPVPPERNLVHVVTHFDAELERLLP